MHLVAACFMAYTGLLGWLIGDAGADGVLVGFFTLIAISILIRPGGKSGES